MTDVLTFGAEGVDSVVVGVDVGGTKTHAAAFATDLRPVLELREPTDTGSSPVVIDSILRTVSSVVDRLDGAQMSAIGIGIPGQIDQNLGSVRQAVNLGIGEDPAEIADRVSNEYGIPCTLENDVNAAALGAYHLFKKSREISDLAYLSIGTGIAAGLILNGRLHRGRRGVAGEIGHFPMMSGGPRCECGLFGCLEAVASGSALAKLWPKAGPLDSGAALIDAAESGDDDAQRVLRGVSDHLARAVHLLALTFDVDLVVLGGGVSDIGSPLLDHIRLGLERLESHSPFVQTLALQERLVLRPSTSAGVVGAAVVGLSGTR